MNEAAGRGRHLICPSLTQTLTRPLNQSGKGGRGGSLDPRWERNAPRTTWIRNQTYNRTSTRGVRIVLHCMHETSFAPFSPPLSRFKLHANCSGPDNCPTRSRQEPRTTELAQAQRRRDIILGPGDLPEDRTAENLVMHTRMSARGGGVSMVEEDKEPTRASVQAGALGRRLSPSRA